MKKETSEKIKRHSVVRKLDAILDEYKVKMITKEKCTCDEPIPWIATHSYEYCRKCTGVIKIRDIDFL